MPDVLDTIDGALRDFGTSRDAMRWAPERVICDGGRPLRTGPCPARPAAPVITVTVDAAQFAAAMRSLAGVMLPGLRSFGEALAKLGAVANSSPAWHEAMYPRSHRRRCHVCNPWGNQPPEAGWYKPGPKAARMRGRRR